MWKRHFALCQYPKHWHTMGKNIHNFATVWAESWLRGPLGAFPQGRAVQTVQSGERCWSPEQQRMISESGMQRVEWLNLARAWQKGTLPSDTLPVMQIYTHIHKWAQDGCLHGNRAGVTRRFRLGWCYDGSEVSWHGHLACRREHGAHRTKNIPQERG